MRPRRVTDRLRAARSDIDKLRDRARRLLDLARRASGEARPDYAALLTRFATEAREQAADMERRHNHRSRSHSTGRGTAARA